MIIKSLINFFIRILEKADDVKKGIFDKNDEKLACYVDCMLKKVGFVSINDDLNRIVYIIHNYV